MVHGDYFETIENSLRKGWKILLNSVTVQKLNILSLNLIKQKILNLLNFNYFFLFSDSCVSSLVLFYCLLLLLFQKVILKEYILFLSALYSFIILNWLIKNILQNNHRNNFFRPKP